MTNPRRLALLALAAALSACKGADYWTERLDADPLYRSAKAVRQAPGCLSAVPMEFGQTFPIPVREGERELFEILFYPANSSPGECTLATPIFAARFEPGSPDSARCVRLSTAPVESLGRCAPGGLSQRRYYRTAYRLFDSLESTAGLYFKGRPPGPESRKSLAEYAEAFEAIAEPGLLPFYYRRNPDFWEWLRRETGRSILKP